MNIVDDEAEFGCSIQTIDVWFSPRRQAWIIERLDADGNQVGAAHVCEEADVAACVADWLRAHNSVHFVTPYEPPGRRQEAPARRSRERRRAA